ncbi:N/A [soil metagenome]
MGAPAAGLPDVLLHSGLVTAADLDRARERQRDSGESLGQTLVDLRLVTEPQLVGALAQSIGLPFVDLTEATIDPMAAALVPQPLLRRLGVLPIGFDDEGRLRVAVSDPSDLVAMDDVRTAAGRGVVPLLATRQDIATAIERYSRLGDSVEDAADSLDAGEEDAELAGLERVGDEAPIVRFVNALITQAVGDRASDIHLEPQEQGLRIRYRIDGVLHEMTTQGRRVQAAVASRLKIMADMDIAERRVPQDGRIGLRVSGKPIDLRVSTLPTVYGEKIVMRILDKSSVLLELSDLGFSRHNFERFESSFRKPYGAILVTGPTGSGKSTTLYATLNILNRPGVNIVTVEDPVEYRLNGVNQVQVHLRAGLTFPTALRSILRQDPDILLVGEMRDSETARIGMEAAMTGHLVLSTLHTNDAPSAVTRLSEMGVDPFLVASSVECVLAQRLARRLCGRCREAYVPTEAELRLAGLPSEGEPPTLYHAGGCRACGRTGYRGRLAVHEVMPVSEEIEQLVCERASSEEVTAVARRQGMRRMREDGLAKVLAGYTTLDELARVVA